MKTIKTRLAIILGVITVVLGCDNDDSINVDSVPEFQSLIQQVSTLPGEEFLFEGIVTDPAGIKSVNFKYDAWYLDKTIIKDTLPETYTISYKFKVPDDAEEFSVHSIPVTVTNAGNGASTKVVEVTLDKDIDAPLILINSPSNGATVLIGNGDEIILDIDLSDRELAEFKIESDILNETIPLSGSSYNYSKSINVTDDGDYEFTIIASDATGNEATTSISVSVVSDLKFNAMYLTDETSDAALNQDIFGIPFSTSGSSLSVENGYVFTGRYYSSVANSEVRFVPQQGSFKPFTFGADPVTPGKLLLGQDETIDPIIIPGVGYYEISMDIRDLTYTVSPYTPTDAAYDQVYILGRGIYIDAVNSSCTNNSDGSTQCWHFNSGKPFTKDASNDYLWMIDVTLQDQPNDNGANGFILNANTSGWSPFWRTNPDDSSQTVPGGGSNYVFDDAALNKDYTFTFDTHLNRIIARER